MTPTTIQIEYAIHHQSVKVLLRFPFDLKTIELIKTLPTTKWSNTHKCWYIDYNKDVITSIKKTVEPYGITLEFVNSVNDVAPDTKSSTKAVTELLQELNDNQKEKITQFKNWLRSKRYSNNTVDSYTDSIQTFLKYFWYKSVETISNEDLITFNNDYILRNHYSASYQNQVVNAVKLFFRTVEDKKLQPELIHRPKNPKLLPNVLSKEEIKLILNAHGNIKHKAMLSLIYSCGLRRSELLNLMVSDIDSKRGLIIIRQAKGKKDRITPLSPKILELLRQYYLAYKPTHWLFEGQNKHEQYDGSSLSMVLKQALDKSGIKKPVSLHWLRHSYATHLLENGTDLRYIQEILGHSRSTTTEIYTHVSNHNIQRIVSPFDSL